MGDRGGGEEIARGWGAGGGDRDRAGGARTRESARLREEGWESRVSAEHEVGRGRAVRRVGVRGSAGCDRREGAGGREYARRGAHLSESEDIVEVGAAGSAAGDARRAGRASAPEPEDVVVVAGWPRGARGRRDQGRAAARG